ncbi:hypothetical protein BE15_22430 [Sorangium cellulosum]|uniref:Uncharacterized protein n=1 Tax=Sorangium cellulosum TaxID=56 RepID=A0A150QY01_SORCE|nr:hypothetical protein BE15_22430 [Sorangium cellulosum]
MALLRAQPLDGGAVVLAGEAKPVAGGVVFEAERAGDVDERHLVDLVHDEEDPPFGIERVEHLGRELQPLLLREVLLAARRGVDRVALRRQEQAGRHLAAAVGAVQVMTAIAHRDLPRRSEEGVSFSSVAVKAQGPEVASLVRATLGDRYLVVDLEASSRIGPFPADLAAIAVCLEDVETNFFGKSGPDWPFPPLELFDGFIERDQGLGTCTTRT